MVYVKFSKLIKLCSNFCAPFTCCMQYAIIIINYIKSMLIMFMMNKLTCKCMNMSMWCGESGHLSHCMGKEDNKIQ